MTRNEIHRNEMEWNEMERNEVELNGMPMLRTNKHMHMEKGLEPPQCIRPHIRKHVSFVRRLCYPRNISLWRVPNRAHGGGRKQIMGWRFGMVVVIHVQERRPRVFLIGVVIVVVIIIIIIIISIIVIIIITDDVPRVRCCRRKGDEKRTGRVW